MLQSQTFKGSETKTKTLIEVLNGSERLGPETKCLNYIFCLVFFVLLLSILSYSGSIKKKGVTFHNGNTEGTKACLRECTQIASLNTDKK